MVAHTNDSRDSDAVHGLAKPPSPSRHMLESWRMGPPPRALTGSRAARDLVSPHSLAGLFGLCKPEPALLLRGSTSSGRQSGFLGYASGSKTLPSLRQLQFSYQMTVQETSRQWKWSRLHVHGFQNCHKEPWRTRHSSMEVNPQYC